MKVFFYLYFFLLLLVNSVLTQVVPLSSRVERAALFDLRASLGIRAKYWPIKAEPCTNWTGVECRNGVVTGINLSGLRRNRFRRNNPSFAIDSLVNCTSLISFNSSGFNLSGPIPDWLGQNLSALQVLDLTSSSILGPIPQSIGFLNRLNKLLLSDNSLTGIIPDSLRQLSSLSTLNLSLNMLSGSIPSSISALSNLSILDLSSNFLSGRIPPEFGSISNLQYLNLSNNSLASSVPVQLGNLSQLVDLDLSVNSLLGSLPKELENLTKLKRLLIGNNDLNCNFPAINLRDIIVLDVSSNNLTGNLPNFSTISNTSGVTLNFSNNIFYGTLNSNLQNVSLIDLSNNYLEGLETQNINSNFTSGNCFLRLPNQKNLDDCSVFYTQRGLPFNGNPVAPVQPATKKHNNRLKYVLAGVFGGIGVVVIITVILLLLLKTCNKKSTSQRSANVEPVQEENNGNENQTVSVDIISLVNSFTYEQMLQATSGFSDTNLIKHGHSGDIFSGKLEDGINVVIKRVDMRSSSQKESYMVELELYSKGAHTRLVPILGHCLEHETEKLLVYKYMPNRDLSNSLYRSTDDSGLQSLDWITRLKIAIGAAEGLTYLHHECNPPLVHRDIQASSILLDDKYDVRLGSLSEVCAQGVDNNQNVITRLLRISSNSELTPSGSTPPVCAYDVYCFGKVLLELVTGKLGISNSEDISSTKEWVDQTLTFINNYDKELVSKIVDQSLVIDEDLLEEVWAVAIVAKSCLNPKPAKRPQMGHILKALENPFRVVREEDFSSGRLRNNSSRRSWSVALFGSWRQSFSGSTNSQSQSQTIKDGNSGTKQSGRDNSQGSGANDKRLSSENFPEQLEINDV